MSRDEARNSYRPFCEFDSVGKTTRERTTGIDSRQVIHIFPDADRLVQALTADILRISREAVRSRGKCFIALSGGSVLHLLHSGLWLFRQTLDIGWSSWHVFWVDERHVPWNSPDSNYGEAKRLFLDHVPIRKDHIHPVPESPNVDKAAPAYEECLRKVLPLHGADVPRFDIVLLGVGEDGHTASLFPGHDALFEDHRLVVPVRQAPKPPPDRVTMTLPMLCAARSIFFCVTGIHKADVVARILANPQPISALPAQMVHPTDGNLLWMMDREAAHRWERQG